MSLVHELSSEFIRRFAAFTRVESRCRSDDLSQGIQAKTADPLWLLARQWQFGEFQGEDAGSPIRIEFSYATQPADTYAANGSVRDFDPSTIPLEVLVEMEKPTLDWRSRARIGQEWERSLRAALPDAAASIIDVYRSAYSLEPPGGAAWDELDHATRRFLLFMKGRVVDGEKLLRESINPVELLSNFGIKVGDPAISTVEQITKGLVERYQDHYRDPDAQAQSAWHSRTLDYSFKLNQSGSTESDDPKTRLVASSYRNGDLDWHTFSIDGQVSGPWMTHYESISGARSSVISRTPTRLGVGGPSLRWWAFEDATIDFGDLDVARTDLAKLALMEFALIYGDDWYTVPITVPMSSFVKITALTAHNVFGESQLICPARKVDEREDRSWDLYSLSLTRNTPAEFLFGWDDVPGSDDDKLIAFLQQRYCLGWVADAKIESSKDNKIRKLSNGEDTLYLKLVSEAGSVVIRINGQYAGGLQAKAEDGKINIYWRIAGNVPSEPILFIPPVAGFREESKPLEEIHVLRDEGANMVWAIEKTILDQMGAPCDGFDAQRERIERRNAVEIRALRGEIDDIRRQMDTEALSDEVRAELEEQISLKLAKIERLERGPYAPEKPANDATLRYRFATTVPENWFPFTPVRVSKDFGQPPPVVRLQRAQMLRNTEDEEPTSIPALSRLLDDAADPLLWIEEHAIGRDGLRLQLTNQRLRWIRGKTFVWLGRKVLIGKGEGSSGLRFDIVNIKLTEEKE
ncbi:MAG: hypothetical protein JXB85_01060 [Anaerolineales bacterium]|nr:hypothetical protein [Anaerolineales bacterium]